MACSAFIFAHMWIPPTHKKPKHTFHLKRSLVSAQCLNMLVFTVFMPLSEFLTLCLLHHWAMWFVSQWNLILLLYAEECFSPGEWQGKFTFLWMSLKSIRLRLHCLLTVSFIKVTHSTHHAKLNSQLFLEVCVFKLFFAAWRSGYCCNRCYMSADCPSSCCKQHCPLTGAVMLTDLARRHLGVMIVQKKYQRVSRHIT